MTQFFRLLLSFFISFTMLHSLAFAQNPSTVQSRTIAYSEAGSGTPLILIHAFPTDQRLWTPQLQGLKSHFRVIALDLWGFGASATTDGSAATMEEYADEVKQLLDQLHIQQAIIGGESMGGYVSLAFLKKYPDKVLGLVLSGTESIAATAAQRAEYEATAVEVLKNGSAQLIADFLPKAISSMASNEVRSYVKNIFASQSLTGIASGLRGIGVREDTSDVLKTTALPVLIITGDQDAVIAPQESINMHALARNSRLLIISNGGHLINLEKPQEWNQAVIDMFTTNARHGV